ncbi:MAG: AgmX/PglI C-terminal domain-containing protein [Polyangiaceae bacterium]|nr:AgmX/PglI C-terminal domain-containing protein [Myxococcales bacterium]MCB9587959.1 AgmX/PglI C-terminal domain-containing protein [Polyangiaceae bacterium]
MLGELAPYGLESGRAPKVPGPSGGSPRPGSRETAAERVARLRAPLRNCYNNSLQTDPSLSGRVVFRMEIDSTGRVTSVAVDEEQTSESLRKSPLTTCLLNVIRSVNTGRTGQTAPLVLSLPIEIRAAEPEASSAP